MELVFENLYFLKNEEKKLLFRNSIYCFIVLCFKRIFVPFKCLKVSEKAYLNSVIG